MVWGSGRGAGEAGGAEGAPKVRGGGGGGSDGLGVRGGVQERLEALTGAQKRGGGGLLPCPHTISADSRGLRGRISQTYFLKHFALFLTGSETA